MEGLQAGHRGLQGQGTLQAQVRHIEISNLNKKNYWDGLINYLCDFSTCCRATEEVFQLLEDNQVTLSTMKASRYVKAFEKEVDHWERTLSHILEVVEMILQVQRQWMYLEVSDNILYEKSVT